MGQQQAAHDQHNAEQIQCRNGFMQHKDAAGGGDHRIDGAHKTGRLRTGVALCHRLERKAEEGSRRAKIAVYISEHFSRFLSTVLVGNNLVNIAASSVATLFFVTLLGMGGSGEVWATVLTTVLLIIFGETMPKIIAADRPDSLARLFAAPLKLCMILFKPLVEGVSFLVNKLSPIWTPKEKAPQTTTDELLIILEDAEEQGVFTEEEGELINNAIEFSDTMAMEVMTPRGDMIAVDADEPLENLTTEMMRHYRLPVYSGTPDNIIGVLPTKTFMKLRLDNDDADIKVLWRNFNLTVL